MGCGSTKIAVDGLGGAEGEKIDNPVDEKRESVLAPLKSDDKGKHRFSFNAKVGGAGKSTFFKQIRKMNLGDFPEDVKISSHCLLINNMLQISLGIIEEGIKLGILDDVDSAIKIHDDLEEIPTVNNADKLKDEAFLTSIKNLIVSFWNRKDIKRVWDVIKMRPEGQQGIENNNLWAGYFFERAEIILTPNYKITSEDIFRLRRETTAPQTINFKYLKQSFELVDVGGQIHERITWASHLNENLNTIIFVISLIDYCHVDSNGKNKMHESLEILKDLVEMPVLKNVPIAVLLNKSDLFEKQLENYDFTHFKPDCDPEKSRNVEYCMELIKDHLLKRMIKIHITNATDTKMVEAVFSKIAKVFMAASISNI